MTGSKSGYAIRELRISDRLVLDELLSHFEPGWEDELAPGASGSLAFITDSATFAFGAYCGEEVAGYAWGYRLRLPTGAKSLLLHDVAVDEAHQRRGVGRLLMEAVLDLARREGHQHAWVVIEATNKAALSLAQSAGGSSSLDSGGDVVFEWRFPGQGRNRLR